MKIIFTLIFLLPLLSCKQESAHPTFLEAKNSDYSFSINSLRERSSSSHNKKYWHVSTYDKGDISLYLYDDNNFYYELENLGNGHGTWTYRDGTIALHAEMDWFDMNYEIFLTRRNPNVYYVRFRDSRGVQVKKIGLSNE